jgi:hypothetical protein
VLVLGFFEGLVVWGDLNHEWTRMSTNFWGWNLIRSACFLVTAQRSHMGWGRNHCRAEGVRDPSAGGPRHTICTLRRLPGDLFFRVARAPLYSGQAGAVDGAPTPFRAERSHELRMAELPGNDVITCVTASRLL